MASLQRRAWNIGVRTAHIAVTGILLGGHVFDVAAARLVPFLWAAIATGGVLVALEAWPATRWLHQGRGLMVLVKLVLLCLIPFAWPHRVPILVAIAVVASVGSHMPARFRYYSLLYREVQK
jgi:hypothetical protein